MNILAVVAVRGTFERLGPAWEAATRLGLGASTGFEPPISNPFSDPSAACITSFATSLRNVVALRTSPPSRALLEQDEIRSSRHPLTRRPTAATLSRFSGEGRALFSRLREKVAGDSRPDAGKPRDSIQSHPALEDRASHPRGVLVYRDRDLVVAEFADPSVVPQQLADFSLLEILNAGEISK